jgi:hypothetical protein
MRYADEDMSLRDLSVGRCFGGFYGACARTSVPAPVFTS